MRPGTLGNPPILIDLGFPLAAPDRIRSSCACVFTLNTDPTVTVSSYDQLANDPDIGVNPDVAYVSGTGAFDQITITKISATQARVMVNAFTDNTYTHIGDRRTRRHRFLQLQHQPDEDW